MSKQIPGATGDPLPAPAITENTWESIRGDHQLIHLGKDWVLDWVPSSGDFRVFLIERDPAADADPLPGSPICFGNWAGIRTGHELVYLGGDRLLDWQPNTKRFRVWLINRAATGNTDPIPGVPQTDGLWTSVDADHRLISLGNDRVLDWVPSTGDYRLWRHDPLTVGAADPLPAPPLNQGRWSSIRSDRRLIPVGNDRVLDWKPSTGDYRVWRYDRTAVGDPFPGEPEVVGQWVTVRTGHDLLSVDGDRLLDWEPANGHFRLYRYDRNVTTLRRATVRLHLKVLTEPRHFSLNTMVANAKALYASYGIDLVEMSRESLAVDGTARAYLQTLFVGDCKRSQSPTDAQVDLFNIRGHIGPRDIVVYFVRELVSADLGCATHPPDMPGAVIAAKHATEWTLAHEIGHVLGLAHTAVANRDRLMNHSTFSVTNPPPDLTTDEINTILASPLSQTRSDAIFPSRYREPLVAPNTPSLQTALTEAWASLTNAQRTALAGIAIGIAHVGSIGSPHPFAGLDGDKMHFAGSMLKMAALYAVFEFQAAANRLADILQTTSAQALASALPLHFNDAIRAAVPRIVRTQKIKDTHVLPTYSAVLQAGTSRSGWQRFDLKPSLRNALDDMVSLSRGIPRSNSAAAEVIHALGYGYINGVLAAGGFFDESARQGIWLAGDFQGFWPPVLVHSENDQDVRTATTARAMTRLLTLMFDGVLPGSVEMLKITSGAGSWFTIVEPSLSTDSTAFKATHVKVGLGPKKNGDEVVSEAAILHERARNTDFAVVWQNIKGPPGAANLRALANLLSETMERWATR